MLLWCVLEPCYDVDAQYKGRAVKEPGKDNVLTNIMSAYECQKKCETSSMKINFLKFGSSVCKKKLFRSLYKVIIGIFFVCVTT